jgi:hypothetical protein
MKWPPVLTLLIPLSVSGCLGSGPQIHDFCLLADQINMHPADQLDPRTEAAITKLDERGQRLCGWKPPGR